MPGFGVVVPPEEAKILIIAAPVKFLVVALGRVSTGTMFA